MTKKKSSGEIAGCDISVIIPFYNSRRTLKACLEAVFAAFREELFKAEVIAVDDGSKDSGASLVSNRFPKVRLFKNPEKGPAAARNYGAGKAGGKILFFLDADVVLAQDALIIAFERFQNPAIDVLNGIYSAKPAGENPGFAASFKALYEYYQFAVRPFGEYHVFMGRCAAIRREAFEKAGGYDTRYKTSSVEQEELGQRLSAKYRIHLDRHMQGAHHFPPAHRLIRSFFQRTYCWLDLYKDRRRLDGTYTSLQTLLGALGSGLWPLTALFCLFNPALIVFLAIEIILAVYGFGGFFYYAQKEKGLAFMLKAVLFQSVLSLVVILSGILYLYDLALSDQSRLERYIGA